VNEPAGTTGAALPSFRNPPVVEVVLGLAFDPSLASLNTVDIYDFYQSRHRAGFPQVEEKPPYSPPIERFGAHARMPEIRFDVVDRPIPTMHWFISPDGSEIVQMQRDWFARNWRAHGEVQPVYPRYPSIRMPFEDDVRALARFIDERKLGELVPRQCEVTYVNSIKRDGVWSSHGDVARVMRNWQRVETNDFSPNPEQVQFAISYAIPDSSKPLGRLHVVLQPAVDNQTAEPIFALTLTARGAVEGGNVSAAMDFLDMGREWIVRCFADITTAAIQDVWGRDE
jgi:uncharacterized protein (TIGR04255 family)